MARWIRTGTHRLGHWNALLPSTTPASQAGILHGNNDGIPNFRWWEKKTGRILVANHPEDATVIERRVSNGEGLLSPGGASISNIFTGDGDRAFLVMSTIKVKERGLGDSDAFAWFFVSPYNYLNMIVRYLAEMIKENVQSRRQARAGIEPRMHRGFPYPAVRAATNVALRSLGTVARHPGDAARHAGHLHGLHRLRRDRPPQRARAAGVARRARRRGPGAQDAARRRRADAPRPYRFVILADHGQSLGATFLQRYGVTLQDVVRSLMGGPRLGRRGHGADRGLGPAQHVPGRGRRRRRASPARSRATVTRNKREDGHVEMGPAEAQYTAAGASPARSGDKGTGAPTPGTAATDGKAPAPADLMVVAGGNLALIYFNASKERMTLEEIDEHYPDLVEGARQPSRHRRAHRPLRGPRPHLRGQGRHPLPRRGPRRRRRPAGGLRRARRRGREASRRHRARRRHRGHQPLRPRDRRDRRVRGAHRRPRRPGRRADAALPALPVRLGRSTSPRSWARRWSTSSCAAGWSASWGCSFGKAGAGKLPAATPASEPALDDPERRMGS